MEYSEIFFLLFSGIVGGILAGMLGIGGGIIYVAVFTTFIQLNSDTLLLPDHVLVKITIANSAFALVFAGLAGCWKQLKDNNFFGPQTFLVGGSGVIGGVIATYLLAYTDKYSTELFALVFSAMIIPIIIKMLIFKNREGKVAPSDVQPIKYIATGFIAGAAMALSGLGGGFLIVPVLNGILNIPIHKTTSISLGSIAISAAGLTIFNMNADFTADIGFNFTIGAIILPMVLPVVIGVLVGTPLGVNFANRLKPVVIKSIFVTFCCLIIARVCWMYLI